MLRNSIQDDNSEFFKLKLSALRPNSNVFKSIKNISGYKKREKLPNVLFDSEQRVNALSTDEEKAAGFANVFAEPFKISTNVRSTIELEANSIYQHYIDTEHRIISFNRTNTALLNENQETIDRASKFLSSANVFAEQNQMAI